MAKRRKVTKKRSGRRRVSGIGAIGNTIANLALVGIGAAVSEIAVNKFMKEQEDTTRAAVQIGAGIAIPMFVKKPMAQMAGYGMIAAGALKFAKANKIIAGIDDGFDVQLSGTGYDPLQSVGEYQALDSVGNADLLM